MRFLVGVAAKRQLALCSASRGISHPIASNQTLSNLFAFLALLPLTIAAVENLTDKLIHLPSVFLDFCASPISLSEGRTFLRKGSLEEGGGRRGLEQKQEDAKHAMSFHCTERVPVLRKICFQRMMRVNKNS